MTKRYSLIHIYSTDPYIARVVRQGRRQGMIDEAKELAQTLREDGNSHNWRVVVDDSRTGKEVLRITAEHRVRP